MIEVHDRLFVGSEADCRPGNDESVVIHARKSPCHQGENVVFRQGSPGRCREGVRLGDLCPTNVSLDTVVKE